jgi:putative transposase
MHTYASIYLHVVFATWSRKPLLSSSLRPQLHAYLATVLRDHHVADALAGGHADHVHLLGRFDPAHAVSTVIGRVKQASTHWLNETAISGFRWQRGFSVFSVSRDRVPVVRRYIDRQEEHHSKRSFSEEFEALLRRYGVSPQDVHLL